MNQRVFAGPWLIAAAVLAGSCGGSDTPPAPTPVTAPVTVAPAPAPTPQAFVCPLPAMPRLNIICPRPAAVLTAQVDAAIARTVAEHPELFNLNDDRGGGS